jgi:hypothetical protein
VLLRNPPRHRIGKHGRERNRHCHRAGEAIARKYRNDNVEGPTAIARWVDRRIGTPPGHTGKRNRVFVVA